MTQRTMAGLIAVPLLLGLFVVALTQPLPYVTYEPGLTLDVLAEEHGSEIIEVSGHQAYHDAGQLRMTTVYVTQPDTKLNIFMLMKDWISSEDAVYPYKSVYRTGVTQEENQTEGSVEMVSSQDAATAVALDELGYDVKPAIEVLDVGKNTPAEGRLKVRDIFLRVNGERINEVDDIVNAVKNAPDGRPVEFLVRRDGEATTVSVTPRAKDGEKQVGIHLGTGFEFPFRVAVHIDPNIGGPSAGLMFSLGIYDTLTPGSLTDGGIVAGTGTIDATGKVGPIGGIQQKIVGARDAGAELFMVPPDNCEEALGAPHGDMRLVRADTMHDAVGAIEAWVADNDAELPTCTKGDS